MGDELPRTNPSIPEASIGPGTVPPPLPDQDGPGALVTNPFLFPMMMLVRPGRTFEYWAPRAPIAVTLLVVYVAGIVRVMGNFESNYFLGRAQLEPVLDSWPFMWAIALLGGIFSGAMLLWVGGWWYRVRLGWSGVVDADRRIANMVYINVDVLAYLIVLGHTLYLTAAYDSPRAYFNDPSFEFVSLIPILLILYTPVMSYRALRRLFDPKRLPALIWFAILPILIRLLALAALVVGVLIGFLVTPADTDHPRDFSNPTFTVEYPGNWIVDQTTAGIYALDIQAPQDAMIAIEIYLSDLSPDEELASTFERFAAEGLDGTGPSTFTRLGDFEGHGERRTATFAFQEYVLEAFVVPLKPGWVLELRRIWPSGVAEQVEPGFDQILASLDITPPYEQPADTAETIAVSEPPFRFDVPSNWSYYAYEQDEGTDDAADDDGGLAPEFSGGTDSPSGSYASVWIYRTASSARAELFDSVAGFANDGETLDLERPIPALGSIAGRGVTGRFDDANYGPATLSVVVAAYDESRVVEVRTILYDFDAELAGPGLELFLGSLDVEPAPEPVPEDTSP